MAQGSGRRGLASEGRESIAESGPERLPDSRRISGRSPKKPPFASCRVRPSDMNCASWVDKSPRAMKPAPAPTFQTATGLARRAGVHRAVVLRLLAQHLLTADAFVDGLGGAAVSPLFLPDRAIDVLRLQRVSHREVCAGAASKITFPASERSSQAVPESEPRSSGAMFDETPNN